MAEFIKSALLIDFDSLYRSLVAAAPPAADRFAGRISSWIAALEGGRLVSAPDGGLQKRKILLRRCYSDPSVLGDRRAQFIAAGFQVVDCPALAGRARNAADIHMVLDTIDALDHPAAYDEFILLSADSDFGPVLLRLRTHNRATVIYAKDDNAQDYSAIADGVFEEGPLLALLTSSEREPAQGAVSSRVERLRGEFVQADRAEIETLARKVHAATNVPLFSPKTYAELFRALAEDIGRHGYHFQKTAENVAESLAAAGRNVTRRQIVFVVKGLALKGHVFSNTDTADRLGDVFREQVLYLVRSAGIDLSEREQMVLQIWIAGRGGSPSAAAISDAEIASEGETAVKAAAGERAGAAKPASRAADDQAARAARRKPVKSAAGGKVEPAAAAVAEAAKPTPVAPRALEGSKPSVVASRPGGVLRPAPSATRPAAASQSIKPAAVSAASSTVRPVPSMTPRPGGERPGLVRQVGAKAPDSPDKDVMESSILAAIAQAVDVLVEDGGNAANRPEAPRAAPDQPPAKAPAGQASRPQAAGDDPDDIGEEIQKIIASYNRDRQQDEP
jgi:hypothetical protein